MSSLRWSETTLRGELRLESPVLCLVMRGEPVEFLGERGGPLRAGNIVAKGLLEPEFVAEEDPPHTTFNATPALTSFTKDATYNNNNNNNIYHIISQYSYLNSNSHIILNISQFKFTYIYIYNPRKDLPSDWFQGGRAIDQRASLRNLDSISSTWVMSPATVTALYPTLWTPSPLDWILLPIFF